MPKEKFEIIGTGNNKIVAEYDSPDSVELNYVALYAPCFTCTKNLRSTKYLAQALNHNGIGLLRFDFPGLGESEGDFSKTNFSTNLDNLRIIYNWMSQKLEAPKLLVGHSLGGAALLRLVPEFKSVKAISVIASPDNPNHLAQRLSKTKTEALSNGKSIRKIGGIDFTLTKEFFEDLEYNGEITNLSEVNVPSLVMHSPDDDTISLPYTFKIFEEVSGQKSFVTLNNVGHLMMNRNDAYYVGNLIANWAKAYI
ncbi:alpha/beta hydrolase [Candidatus Kapabacteria bacterium]|nr:alpha/beta hydrolase [Candidatus Kapabacteria bacterium]